MHAVDGLRRLRFTTSHPEHVDVRMARAMRDLDRLCPYLHLPFQSGSERVLASMRRGYSRAEFLDKVALLRDHVPHLALSTDVIVGYPAIRGRVRGDAAGPRDGGLRRPVRFLYSPAGHDRHEARGRRVGGREAPAARGQRPPTAVAAAAERGFGGDESGGSRRSRRRRRPRVGCTPHFKIVHLEGSEPSSAARCASTSPPPAPTRSRVVYRKSFIDREFRAPIFSREEGEGSACRSRWPSRD